MPTDKPPPPHPGLDGIGLSDALIIFDCDGVLVDTEALENRVLASMVRDLGYPMGTDEAVRRFRGVKMALIVEEIEALVRGPMPTGFVDLFRARSEQLFREDLQAVAGVGGVLDWLEERGTTYCVASSGPMQKMRVTLKATGLWDRFAGRIFSAYDVGIWKPDPGLFLHAAQAMGVNANQVKRCVVVEDSEPGVRAGVSAGMRVLGYAAHGQSAALAAVGAEVYFDMGELPGLISSMFKDDLAHEG